MTCFLFVLDSSPCASYMEFISFFFLGNVKQILAAIEHCGCNFWFLAASLAPSSNVQRGTPSFVLCCPYNYRSSPISFCPKACSKFTRDSELKHQELEARSEYVVCNPVIKELSNFFFTDFQRLVLSLGTSWSWTWKAWVAGGSGPLGNWCNECSERAFRTEWRPAFERKMTGGRGACFFPGALECAHLDGMKCYTNTHRPLSNVRRYLWKPRLLLQLPRKLGNKIPFHSFILSHARNLT